MHPTLTVCSQVDIQYEGQTHAFLKAGLMTALQKKSMGCHYGEGSSSCAWLPIAMQLCCPRILYTTKVPMAWWASKPCAASCGRTLPLEFCLSEKLCHMLQAIHASAAMNMQKAETLPCCRCVVTHLRALRMLSVKRLMTSAADHFCRTSSSRLTCNSAGD